MSFLQQINRDKCPKHVAVIMDGNGRWAKQQGEQRLFGHSFGVESVREVLKTSRELNIKYLTLYVFSTENWNRPEEEVNGLMNLLVKTIANEVEELDENDVRLRSMGDKSRLPKDCKKELEYAIESTKNNRGIDLILALNYSSRWEIIEAVKNIAKQVQDGKMKPENISDEVFAEALCLADVPDPELLIRTSGEYRISNFLLWQIAYSELYFTNKLWPDFKREDFYQAIVDFQNRERRFGKVSEQFLDQE